MQPCFLGRDMLETIDIRFLDFPLFGRILWLVIAATAFSRDPLANGG
jgi:hypothetical protein